MDRASFLRALPYLRPLPPSVWSTCCDLALATTANTGANDKANNDGNNQVHSSSPTASLSTPTGNQANRLAHDAVVLFEKNSVVSIEPNVVFSNFIEADSEENDSLDNDCDESNIKGHCKPRSLTTSKSSRKRTIDDNMASSFGSMASAVTTRNGPPAFFHFQHKRRTHTPISIARAATVANGSYVFTASGVQDALEAEAEKMPSQISGMFQQLSDEKLREEDIKYRINMDSSLCCFDAAIVSKKSLESMICGVSLPNRQRQEHSASIEAEAVLIFRFGSYFVYQVDESFIEELKYEHGHYGEPNTQRKGGQTNSM